MRLTKSLAALAGALTLASCIHAAMPISEQREYYLQALDAAESGKQEQLDRLMNKLADYPLLPYLSFNRDSQAPERLSEQAFEQLLEQYQDTPLAARLISTRAIRQAQQEQWSAFRQTLSRIDNPSARLQCYDARAELSLGSEAEAMRAAARLWTVGQSQHGACDPLFEHWRSLGGPDSAQALERMLLALENNNVTIARFAERFVDDADKSLAGLIWDAYNTPERFATHSELLNRQQPMHRRIATLATSRLARNDLSTALRMWTDLTQRLEIPIAEQEGLSSRLGVLYAKRFPSDGEAVLARLDPQFSFPEVTEWRIRLALTEQNWSRVGHLIGQLPDHLYHNGRWQYWRAVTLMRQGETPDEESLERLVAERSFYGFKAAELTQRPFNLNDQPGNFSASDRERLRRDPAMQRLHELYRLKQYDLARAEWNLLTQRLDPDQLQIAGHIIRDWGWYFQGIRTAIAADRWDDLTLRFPAPHSELFARATTEFNIEPAWALAVTRQESAFLEVARSGAGARGLMQLMPATARETARRYNIPLANLDRLNDPDINIQLGSAYLAQMQSHFGGNRVHATAAYNAGPGRVRQWLNARGHLPLDIWVETIPFDETRGYVQNVLTYGVIYNRMANQPARVFSDQERQQLAWLQHP